MPATVEMLPIPLGSQLVSTISRTDPEDKNDFRVLLIFSENITGLVAADITLSVGATLVSLAGKHSVWEVTIRPPQTETGTVTVTVNQNAVSQGNPQTSKSIRISTAFPDTDAEDVTQLFTHRISLVRGIAVTPTRILLSSGRNLYRDLYIRKYTHAGVEQTSEQSTISSFGGQGGIRLIDYINGDILVSQTSIYRLREDGTSLAQVESTGMPAGNGITHCRLGYTSVGTANPMQISTRAYGETNIVQHVVDSVPYRRITHQDDLFFLAYRGFATNIFGLAAIADDDTINFVAQLNINPNSVFQIRDIAVYRDTLYILEAGGVYTVDIRKYRPIVKNTKTTIYPVFANEGDTIDLTQFSPDAERIVFDVGYDKQPQLSINTSNQLGVGSGAQTCLVKLKAINRVGATEADSFQFYLIVRQATAPVWRNVSELTMRAGSRYDLFGLVPDADTIAFRSGRTRLAGSRLSNGVFTVGTVGGVAEFTAQKGGLNSHIAITINIVEKTGSERSEVSGYRVEIAGIDVTSDSVALPSVSETLDPVVINEYRVNEAAITLRNEGGKYNSEITGNFWETNELNAGGFQNAVKIYLAYIDGSERLLFSGVINEAFVPIKGATLKLNCSDISSRLRKALVQSFGTLEKWDALRKQSDEDSYEGSYVPEQSVLPMQVGTGKARSDRTDLAISRLALPSEGPTPANTGYMTPTEFRTAGGFLEETPLLGFMTEHRSEDVRFLINQLAINKEIYNTEIDIPGVELEAPFLLNRGSVAFSVEQTRTTRLPVDWVYDSTNNRMLMLLSNPEGHISDLLVQYDVEGDRYRVLRTFEKDISVHRIERRNATNYYILTSAKITQDRSARQTDGTGYAYDSLAAGSEIKIYHYSTSTGTLTEHVAEDDSFPPQVSIHYWIGFENGLYTDTFEGIRPDYRGPFKWHSNNLYYRYAKDGEFGVARVNTGGTTTKLIGETNLNYHNHLNFAFDINSAGTLYFAYATGDTATSTLIIKRRTSSGTETTLLTETRGIGHFDELGFDFGAFLGVQEVLFHSNSLYLIVPIQKADFGENAKATNARPTFRIEREDTGMTGERYVTSSTNLNPTSKRLAPGDDIPIRIDFNGSVSGATQSDLTVYGGTIQSFSISSDMIDVTIRPEASESHKNIVIDLAENAVTQRNEKTRIIVDFGTKRSSEKSAGCTLYRCNVNATNPSLTVVETWEYVQLAGCNLTVHEGNVHYVENPPASTKFKPYNPDL